MKKLLTAILSLSLLTAAALPALAADSEPSMVISPGPEAIASAPEEAMTPSGFSIAVDGEQINARACVMIPLRSVAEKLGFTVAWENGVVTVTQKARGCGAFPQPRAFVTEEGTRWNIVWNRQHYVHCC